MASYSSVGWFTSNHTPGEFVHYVEAADGERLPLTVSTNKSWRGRRHKMYAHAFACIDKPDTLSARELKAEIFARQQAIVAYRKI
jgi:hypothetical protein